MTNVEALKSLYTQLGGEASAVADANDSVEVLNAIALKYGGEAAETNAEAVANIAAVADSIGGGDVKIESFPVTVNLTNQDGDPLTFLEYNYVMPDGTYSQQHDTLRIPQGTQHTWSRHLAFVTTPNKYGLDAQSELRIYFSVTNNTIGDLQVTGSEAKIYYDRSSGFPYILLLKKPNETPSWQISGTIYRN